MTRDCRPCLEFLHMMSCIIPLCTFAFALNMCLFVITFLLKYHIFLSSNSLLCYTCEVYVKRLECVDPMLVLECKCSLIHEPCVSKGHKIDPG